MADVEVSVKAQAMVTIVDGNGVPFDHEVTLNVHNGSDIPPRFETGHGPNIFLVVPFHNGIGDNYAVSVSAPGYRQNGSFFKADLHVVAQPKVLLLKNQPIPRFQDWQAFKASHPISAAFLTVGQSDAEAQTHYEQLRATRPGTLACLLNLTEAMSEIDLDGRTLLSYFKAICWDNTMAQDRFFGYVDPAIIPLVRAAAAKNQFDEEVDCQKYHPGATCSWKQRAFTVTNVQLTFHENAKQVIDSMPCIKIEPDIDIYRELLAHGFGEVFPNLITGKKTNPFDVFSMRWTLANDEQGPMFDPGYGLA